MERKLKIASWILVGALLLPLFQQITGLAHERKLRGSYAMEEVPAFAAKGWFDGSWQEKMEKVARERVGFRNLLIRIHNQVYFTFYRKPRANGVILGKDNYLYERNYIHAYMGTDFLGDSLIEAKARQLKQLQDHLDSAGTHFFVAFAVGKGSFYPEYIPDRYRQPTGKSNLRSYKHYFDAYGVNYIDFNKWFLEMKDTSRYILYPRTGIHWSYYGMTLVSDSLVNYMEEKTGNDFPEYQIGKVKLSRKYRGSDADMEEAMNIIFRVSYDKLAYPRIIWEEVDADEKSKAILISDSFYWGIHNTGFSHLIFDAGEFWYYNKQHFKVEGGTEELDEVDRLRRMENADVVMVMAADAMLPKFPYGIGEVLSE